MCQRNQGSHTPAWLSGAGLCTRIGSNQATPDISLGTAACQEFVAEERMSRGNMSLGGGSIAADMLRVCLTVNGVLIDVCFFESFI